jgi:Ni,Fe-hydrogenase maturation factor
MKVLVFGNPLVKGDSLPLRMLPELRKAFPGIEFREFDAAEDLEREGRELLIIDSVRGIGKVGIYKDTDAFLESPRFSLHDFDLPIYLRLLKKAGIVEKVTIIGVPADGPEKETLAQAKAAIRMILDGKAD